MRPAPGHVVIRCAVVAAGVAEVMTMRPAPGHVVIRCAGWAVDPTRAVEEGGRSGGADRVPTGRAGDRSAAVPVRADGGGRAPGAVAAWTHPRSSNP